MKAREYHYWIEHLIGEYLIVVSSDISFEEIDLHIAYIKGKLEFINGSVLYFMEYVEINDEPVKQKYKYQWQTKDNKLIGRWDNAKHHPQINTFPHHFHNEDNIPCNSEEMNLQKVLTIVEKRIFL